MFVDIATKSEVTNLEELTCEYTPDSGRYEGGTFVFNLTFEDDYPKSAIKVQFKTFVFHPRVNASNGQCEV